MPSNILDKVSWLAWDKLAYLGLMGCEMDDPETRRNVIAKVTRGRRESICISFDGYES